MKAMTINNFGGTEEFVAAEVAKPQVTAGNVLVRIAATSVNTIDMMIRQMGADLPFAPKLPGILGMDFAGTIEAVGDGVTEFTVGDEIYGCAGGLGDLPGALAEFMLADKRLIAHKPKNLTMKEAAAIPLVGITALEGLTRANVKAGQKVLVHGGAGGVGHLAVQLAKHFGADVYSTGGNAEQLALIESFGATGINFKDETVEQYVEKHTSNVGFDMVFDTVGGGNLTNSFAAAKLNAQISTTLSLLEVDLSPVHFKGLSLNVIFMLIPMIHDFNRQDHGDKLAKLAQIVEAGGMRPVLDEQDFSLEDAAKAHDRLASGQAMGKVVISVQ